ncbi:VOC family protein [Chitinophaga rhizophila]|uniref:VOC family protein n=1 Tax=Chitinophaga rhizophila TaxID=2866212 RepID=A0ABS7GIF5_9BACT|nr:VOC family protein [Chitinophaga rhizophila]MBW8687030.1 VOC family protein [Chitinophaga rhizophila]
MASLNPYLIFNGNCEEAFNFYKSVFGGAFHTISKFNEMPGPDLSPADGNKIMHIALPIGDKDILMGSDCGPGMEHVATGDNMSISISTYSEEETRNIFDGLAAGGNITMPLEKTFWSPLFGMVKDKFSVNWMISYDTGEAS